MDFFGEQRTRTQRSLLLYGLFFLIVFAHIAVALGVMVLLLTVFTGGIYHWALVLVILWTLGSFAGGSFLEYRRLKAGGRSIAQRVGAVRLFIDDSQDAWEHSQGVAHQHEPVQKVRYSARHIAVRDERDFPPTYRRYYEIAQQLAIASGLTMPILYVLPEEQGINGFVAGRHSQDMVLVVTQGALDKLSDEALYGLIGHEYGHILHGDANFNLQLMVVLAGLQILYDWSDPIGNDSYFGNDNYFDNTVNQNFVLSQQSIDRHARSTENQTASFTTHSEWVAYWQNQSQNQQATANIQSRWLQNKPVVDRQAPRGVWTLLLHGMSFSSMASAQLIKHSFNRQRELLADATSVQLTRSPAIMETLKAIHQDSLGSRLTGITDINGLSHFFFASSGTDLGDVSWFATHPSLSERMSAINENAYHKFSAQVAKEKRINQKKVKEIYEQRRLGDWGAITANSLSNKAKLNKQSLQSQSLSNQEMNNELEAEKGLEFVIEQDVVVDGRLQVQAEDIGTLKQLKPWQAQPDSDLPVADLISIDDIKKVSLPQYVLNHSHHPLGAQALIEAVMLCHQGHALEVTASYDLADIWSKIATDAIITTNITKSDNQTKILPHTIDNKLIESVATMDRRLDSVLITTALKKLSQHDLSSSMIETLRQQHESSHSNKSHQDYSQQAKYRTMLTRYQQGIMALINHQLSADLSKVLADKMTDESADIENTDVKSNVSQAHSILSLWQALHLQPLLSILSMVLGDQPLNADKSKSWQYTLQTGANDIYAQLDPSGQIFVGLDSVEKTMLALLAYRLSKDVKGQMISERHSSMLGYNDASVTHYIVDLRRHARLIDIDLAAVSDANLQWLLLTTQSLNSIQLLALIETVPTFVSATTADTCDDNDKEKQQGSDQIDYNNVTDNSYTYIHYQQWLSTLHTVMLHDTIVSQDEYDCLMLLADRWLGIRKLF